MKKRGYSLVEMIVVISIGSVLATLAVTLLGTLLRASGTLNEQIHGIATVRRMAEQFRDDAHAALRVENLPKEGENPVVGLRFQLAPGRTVTYEFPPKVVERTERIDDAVHARETFFLPPGTNASAAVSTAASAPVSAEEKVKEAEATLVALVVKPDSNAASQPDAESDTAAKAADAAVRMEAVVAKDHRFNRMP